MKESDVIVSVESFFNQTLSYTFSKYLVFFISQKAKMSGINKVLLIGNAGKDPELRTLQDGTPVAKLTIATTENYQLKNGDTQSRTEWYTIIAWRGLATFASDYIHKGSLLYIEGKLRSRRSETKDKQTKQIPKWWQTQVVMLDKKVKATEERIDEVSKEELPF